jgi:hypothetical protein
MTLGCLGRIAAATGGGSRPAAHYRKMESALRKSKRLESGARGDAIAGVVSARGVRLD